jgi:hypothetical protein
VDVDVATEVAVSKEWLVARLGVALRAPRGGRATENPDAAPPPRKNLENAA